jgi:outer membrane protein assembly factor BamB
VRCRNSGGADRGGASSGGLLYATSGSRVYALDAGTGKTRWHEDEDPSAVAADNTTAFVGVRVTSGGLHQTIYALRATP